jgi:hypothetical protein
MSKLSESTKYLKICLEPAFWNIKEVGIKIYPGPSSHTTTTIKRDWRWPHLRFSMDDGAVHHSIRLSQERKWYSDSTSSKKLKQPFAISKIIWKPQNHTKRLMQTRGIDHQSSKLEIMCTWESHWWKVPCYIEPLDLQVRLTTILSWISRHLPHVTIEEMLKGTRGCHVAQSDTARGWLVVP